MAYKDKDKQKQAQREAARRYRDRKKYRAKGMTAKDMTQEGSTEQGSTKDMTFKVMPYNGRGNSDNIEITIEPIPIPNFGQPDCECQHCQTNRANGNRHTLNHGLHKPADELGRNELNRVALPGDADYTGVANCG